MLAIWKNKGMLFNPAFGRYGLVVFPLEFFLLFVSPLLLVVDIIAAFHAAATIDAALSYVLALASLLLAWAVYAGKSVFGAAAFLDAQFSGIRAMPSILAGKDIVKWEKI